MKRCWNALPLVLALPLISCGAAERQVEARNQPPEPKQYTLNLVVAKAGERRINIEVETDLPEGANLLVDVTRDFLEMGDPETFVGEIYERDHPVENGRIELAVDVVDSWFTAREEQREQWKGFGVWNEIDKSSISPQVEVSVLCSPRRQPTEIRRALGANGEFIGGSFARKEFGVTTMRVSEKITVPLTAK